MVFPKKQLLHEQTKLVDLDTMFHGVLEAPTPPAAPVVTGLSDEEDALRHLAERFDPDLKFCTNCEVAYHSPLCMRCFDMTSPMGTPPRKKKHT